jgi:hypothetical protein
MANIRYRLGGGGHRFVHDLKHAAIVVEAPTT